MKEPDPIKFGKRVRDLRMARGLSQAKLGKLSGYSQTNIGWIEQGSMKRPRASAAALSEALRSPVEYLLWGTGAKEIGPPVMTGEEIRENYDILSLEDQAAITAEIAERIAAAKEKRKTG